MAWKDRMWMGVPVAVMFALWLVLRAVVDTGLRVWFGYRREREEKR